MEFTTLPSSSSLPTFRALLLGAATAVLFCGPWPAKADPSDGPNLIAGGDFASMTPTYVPWAGVDAQNYIHGIEGKQLSVDDEGHITRGGQFAPSVAVGDLSGSGKKDLVMADSYGYFWYFRNFGTAQAPSFTQGEVIPIWLGEQPTDPDALEGGNRFAGVSDTVPRIQLLSFNNDPRLDIVAGVFTGKLFHIPNIGSTAQPLFKPTQNASQFLINTHRHGVLWCNYLAPVFTTAFSGGNIMDLLVGEGTYSANSLWLLRNTENNENPAFDEDHLKRLIPGMGLEQLTPCVVDWNNDGKPDIICGDRTGDINLYLNNSTDPQNPTFAPGTPLSIGDQQNFGGDVTVTVGDLSNNHLPNLLIGREDGTVLYAVNTGTPGNPKFATPPQPLKGVLPPTYHFNSSPLWYQSWAWGIAYELVGVVNAQTEAKTQPNFTMPDGVTTKNALKFWVWPYKNLYFGRYYPAEETEINEHRINYRASFTLKMNTDYRLSFWVMAPDDSPTNFRYRIGDEHGGSSVSNWVPPGVVGDIGASSQWTQVTKDFRIENDPDPLVKEYPYRFDFRFQGQATFYIADLQLREKMH